MSKSKEKRENKKEWKEKERKKEEMKNKEKKCAKSLSSLCLLLDIPTKTLSNSKTFLLRTSSQFQNQIRISAGTWDKTINMSEHFFVDFFRANFLLGFENGRSNQNQICFGFLHFLLKNWIFLHDIPTFLTTKSEM